MISTVNKAERHADEVSYTAPFMLRGATLTQFARNALCVLKTLTPKTNFMFQKYFSEYHGRPKIPLIGLEIPIDISKVTYFEWLITVRGELHLLRFTSLHFTSRHFTSLHFTSLRYRGGPVG